MTSSKLAESHPEMPTGLSLDVFLAWVLQTQPTTFSPKFGSSYASSSTLTLV